MILGVDAGSRTLPEAEHLLHTVARALGLPGGTIGCTHFVPAGTGEPHIACSLAVPGPVAGLPGVPEVPDVSWALAERRAGPLADGAALAAAEHGERRAGRVVTYPGRDGLTGTVSVGALLGGSAIERVLVLASPDPPGDDVLVVTAGHVRPVWRDGLMTLLAMPAAGGRIAPAEVPNPTPCCADHA
ncbi:hypothetical protein [Nonomuraea sp. SYSU D8015]|uniref:hypothetical protein n=1 Tax=Nonomuraea sp. SYSU D8015 TaxID=2593644 RepID=UPI001CB710E3|nr:hypothetical protein [Nonomuraea sp. SYSU D8015]